MTQVPKLTVICHQNFSAFYWLCHSPFCIMTVGKCWAVFLWVWCHRSWTMSSVFAFFAMLMFLWKFASLCCHWTCVHSNPRVLSCHLSTKFCVNCFLLDMHSASNNTRCPSWPSLITKNFSTFHSLCHSPFCMPAVGKCWGFLIWLWFHLSPPITVDVFCLQENLWEEILKLDFCQHNSLYFALWLKKLVGIATESWQIRVILWVWLVLVEFVFSKDSDSWTNLFFKFVCVGLSWLLNVLSLKHTFTIDGKGQVLATKY